MQAIFLRAGTALQIRSAATFALALTLSVVALVPATDTASAGFLRGR